MANLTTTLTRYFRVQIYDYMYLELWAKLNSQDKINNTSSVYAELRIDTTQTAVHCYTHSASFGGNFSNSTSSSSYYHGWEKNTTTTILTETKTFKHDDTTGEKSISITGSFSCSAGVSASGSSGTLVLPTIQRGFTEPPVLTISNITETTVNYNWTTNENCDKIKVYYRESGASSWSGGSEITLGSVATSGSGTLNSLTANRKYDFKIACDRATTSVYTDSNVVSEITTETFPYVKSITSTSLTLPIYTTSTITQSLNIYNPLKRAVDGNKNITITVQSQENTSSSWTFSGNNISWNTNKDVATINLNTKNLYTTLGVEKTLGHLIYSCKWTDDPATTVPTITGEYITTIANCGPKIPTLDPEHPENSTLTYRNITPTHVELLGSNQYIIQNQSEISIMGPMFYIPGNTEDPITGEKDYSYGKIDYYILKWGNEAINRKLTSNSVEYNSIADSSNVTIEMWAIDKRGYSSDHVTKTINVLPYSPPSATLELKRTGTYESGAGEIIITAKRSALTIGSDKNHWTASSQKISYVVKYTDSQGEHTFASGTINNTGTSIDASNGGKIVYSGGVGQYLNPNLLYTATFNISDELYSNRTVSGDISQAISSFDFNLEAPAIGIGTSVNKDGITSGLYAHGLDITDGGNSTTSKIQSSTVNIGNSDVNYFQSTVGVVNLDGYVTETAQKKIENLIADKTGAVATSTEGVFSSTTINNKKVGGELYIGGGNTPGKIYLYNGAAYIPIIWYQDTSQGV